MLFVFSLGFLCCVLFSSDEGLFFSFFFLLSFLWVVLTSLITLALDWTGRKTNNLSGPSSSSTNLINMKTSNTFHFRVQLSVQPS